MATVDKRKTGAKTSRSEVVTVRLDPKLRYLAEIASRKHRRTLSSFVEWAVETSLDKVELETGPSYEDTVTVANVAYLLWDVDEAERFVKLARLYPELMTHDEQERFKLLLDSQLLDCARSRDGVGNLRWDNAKLEDKVCPVLRRLWPSFMTAYESGQKTQREWVDDIRHKIAAGRIYAPETVKDGDMPDDIPF